MLDNLYRKKLIIKVSIVGMLLTVLAVYFLAAVPLPPEPVKLTEISAINNPKAISSTQSTTGIATVADLVEGLRIRVESEPEDMDGWVLLGKSYHYLQQQDKANAAFRKAKSLGYTGDIPYRVSRQDFRLLKTPPAYNNLITRLIAQTVSTAEADDS